MGLFDKMKQAAANVSGNQTVTFTFQALPESLAQMQALPEASLDTPFKTAALTVCALCAYGADKNIGLEMLKDADELWCFSEYISEGMMAEIQEASRLGLPVRMFCETTGLLGKVLKRVVSDLYSDADDRDRQ